MKKLITICDYCGRQIEENFSLLPVKLSEQDNTCQVLPDSSPNDMCIDCLMGNLVMIRPGPLQRKEAAASADPEEHEAPGAASEEPEEQKGQQAEAVQQEEMAAKKAVKKSKVDHGRIVALYTANPPRSIEWIADDCMCSQQTVINHLKQEGIYKTLQERRDGKQEETE